MRERIKAKTLITRGDGDDANGVLIKLYGEETNGTIAIIEQPFEPGLLLPPHVHRNDVWLYVLEGVMHARIGDEVVKAAPGSWVLKPRRIPHTIWNAGRQPARIIGLYTPGGFELFFKDFGERLRQGPIGLDELNRLGEPHASVSSTTGSPTSKLPTTCASSANSFEHLKGDSILSELERVALDYADRVSAIPVDVPDEFFVNLARLFSEREIVELTAHIAQENYNAKSNRPLRVEANNFCEINCRFCGDL